MGTVEEHQMDIMFAQAWADQQMWARGVPLADFEEKESDGVAVRMVVWVGRGVEAQGSGVRIGMQEELLKQLEKYKGRKRIRSRGRK